MWLDLAELKLILDALEQRERFPPEDDRQALARATLRAYIAEQVERTQQVDDDWQRRRKAEAENEHA